LRIAISTGGGDAPGLNAVIRSAALSAIGRGWDVLGICRGYYGLLGEDEIIPLTRERVRGIAHLGGTILRTTNRGNPFAFPTPQPDGSSRTVDRSDEVLKNAQALGIEALISIGGDGSLAIAQRLFEKGLRVVGVPKTIDNDVSGTITTFGFDTAVNTAIEAIDKLHTTAESHDRVIIMEVMGRHAGFIALHAGVAGTADVILIPEIPYDLDRVCEKIRARDKAGRHFSIVVVAEGAFPVGGEESTIGESLPGAGSAGWRDRGAARVGNPGTDREGSSFAGAGSSPARRNAYRIRPAVGSALRGRRRRSGRATEVGTHGGAAIAAHRRHSDRGRNPGAEACRSRPRHRPHRARDRHQLR
jgi:6-phosphofructokinase 1